MEESSPARKLAAILIADAVGYSLRMANDDERALRALNTRRALIEQIVANHRGRVFGGAGDSIVAECPSAVDALRSAIEAQGAISLLNKEIPEADAMSFRMGINLGDVIVEGQNLFGDGVNIAERLQALAAAGSICISSSVHEQVRDKVHVAYADLGEQMLKNIAHPVRTYFVQGQTGEQHIPILSPSKSKRLRFMALMTFAGILVVFAITYLQLSQHGQT